MAELAGPEQEHEREEHEDGQEGEPPPPAHRQQGDGAGSKPQPRPSRVGHGEPGHRHEPHRRAPRTEGARKDARQRGEQHDVEHSGQRHVDAEKRPGAIAAMEEPAREPGCRLLDRARGVLHEPSEGGAARGQREPREEAVALDGVLEGVGRDVERGHQQQALGGDEALHGVTGGEGGENRGPGER